MHCLQEKKRKDVDRIRELQKEIAAKDIELLVSVIYIIYVIYTCFDIIYFSFDNIINLYI